MDLFDDKEKYEDPDDKGFSAEAAKLLVEIHSKYFPDSTYCMYPFNHIRVAAHYGKTSIQKPTNGLSPKTANHLRRHGFNVDYSLENGQWTISWG